MAYVVKATLRDDELALSVSRIKEYTVREKDVRTVTGQPVTEFKEATVKRVQGALEAALKEAGVQVEHNAGLAAAHALISANEIDYPPGG